ncbi:G-type lectin S-receptor-like serine/threonine-protein kinase At4g27290 [Diospyros lotus]|uniref:G-type lectin S-receptor-like serine/threonine-protein kinase At4g27290 n=1 Tax=Diospyros lotus TaxID=55363 RepID=UPI00224E7269|nr:G-type lectin S-receptor-like serine/threonine-protein kinase At4g27290 [Diospyros lotus]
MAILSLSLTLCCLCISLAAISATDTLTPLQRLKVGQSLISANQRFELGFFAPPGQIKIRYLGIWYRNINPLTVVWVANRTNPVKNLHASLMLDFNGGLSVQDRRRCQVLLSMPAKTVQNPVMQLLDSGNLVVRDDIGVSSGGYLWQSFDYPSDTLLPETRIGWDYESRRNRVITSWKNIDDPSTGDFTFGLEKPQLPQLVLKRNSNTQSRWGPWDGVRFSGTNVLGTNPVFHPMFMSQSNGLYFSFNVIDESALVRLVLTSLGQVQFLVWNSNGSKWIPMVTLNGDACEGYGLCGLYGVCYLDGPNCRCLKGFNPNSMRDWTDKMDLRGGCSRNFKLNCDGDGFVKYKGLKLPDNAIVWPDLLYKECEKICLRECSCMAFAFINIYGNGSNCVVWLDRLLDMRGFLQGGDEIHIRMARDELESIASAKRKRTQTLIAVILALVVTGMVLLGFLRWCCVHKVIRSAVCRSNPLIHSNGCQEENSEFKHFNIRVISAATDNFSNNNKIGQGGFGPVYMGELPSGQLIAVKRLSRTSQQGVEQFETESSLIARLQHRYLVKLLGCCVHEEERMLIYEYLPNKSLDKFIFDEARKGLLSWAKRFDIILGVAKGLAYLHDDSGLRIVHRDLKASNILLDSEMMPKISDFGLAKILEGNHEEATSRRVIGTYGYISPEYAMQGQFSVKSDVFSFGVLVLEIVSGQRNWGYLQPDQDLNLVGHGWNLWRQGKALELVDSTLEGSFSEIEILRSIQVGLLCVQNIPTSRPTMSTVVYMLSNKNMELPQPMEPGFFARSSPLQCSVSANGLTLTTLTPR